MIKPILACRDPYQTALKFSAAGWNVDFSNPPESGDPLVGVSLCGNTVLLGITEGYVAPEARDYIGCGVEIYLTVPGEKIREIYKAHELYSPSRLAVQPWGELAFEVNMDGFQFMIASEKFG